MKSKKIISGILAVVLSLTSVATFTGCGDKGCEHAYSWNVLKEANCNAEGTRQGVCGICGDVVEEAIPIDTTAHDYGSWEITKPSESEEGKAKKVCSRVSTHTLEVTLPKITESGTGYDKVEVVKAPTAVVEGESKYTIKNDEGDITFTLPIATTGINSVGDAVEVGVSNKSKVRSASGTAGYTYYNPTFVYKTDANGKTVLDDDGDPVIIKGYYKTDESGKQVYENGKRVVVEDENSPYLVSSSSFDDSKIYAFSYEFGDGYTHILEEGDDIERWYSVQEDGSVWGRVRNKSTWEQDTDKRYIDGQGFTLVRSGGGSIYYGTEGLLQGMYSLASLNANGDFKEWQEDNEEGETLYCFSFGLRVNSGNDYFAVITVEFTLTDGGVIKTLDVSSMCYRNRLDTTTYDYYSRTWKTDSTTGYSYVCNPEGSYYNDLIHIEQETVEEAEAAGKEVPVNPYSREDYLVASYKLSYNSKTVKEDEAITIDANKNADLYILSIKNNNGDKISDFTDDPIKIYQRTAAGDVAVASLANDSLTLYAFYKKSSTGSSMIELKCRQVGTIVLVLKTEATEKVITINVQEIAPTSISSNLYTYNTGVYTWNKATSGEVYVNQPTWVKATVPEAETNYAYAGYKAELVSTNKANATLVEDALSGETVYKFLSSTVGTYQIKLTSTFETDGELPTVTLTIVVKEAPDVSAHLYDGAEYRTTFKYSKGTATVVITTTDENSGIAEVTTNGGSETLAYTIENGEITTTHQDGANLGFMLKFNEAYDLVLSYYVKSVQLYDDCVLIAK